MRWILLSIGILMELCGSTCMKLSKGFTNLYASIFTFVFWIFSFCVFIYALKYFDLSFAYAVWTGMGILLVSVIGMVFFKEPATMMKVISILIIITGVIMLNFSEKLIHP